MVRRGRTLRYCGSSTICSRCGQNARFVEWRDKTIVSLFGSVTIRFAYYHCRHCRKGYRPWCDKLRLSNGALTPAADKITALAGVLGSFVDGAQRMLWKMVGLRLGESTVERTTEAAGQRVRQ